MVNDTGRTAGDGAFTLVVMAAGLGSRFGGTKQLAQIGPNGEAFLDFAIHDARAAGVSSVVLIVRSDIEADVRRHVDAQHPGLDVAYVLQDTHGPVRSKPWGTAHAVLTAAPAVTGPFLVINADDYYGRSTYQVLVDAAAALGDDRILLAGFALAQTLPSHGEVTRGICTVADGELVSLVETSGIGRRSDGSITSTEPAGSLAPDTVASMNCWAFPHSLFGLLETRFETFLAEHGDEPTTEFLLPSVINELRIEGRYRVDVVSTSEQWIGVTNPEDLAIAQQTIRTLRA
jgi:GTP:adenosylcobinamide-phosphate guanylyltransferase